MSSPLIQGICLWAIRCSGASLFRNRLSVQTFRHPLGVLLPTILFPRSHQLSGQKKDSVAALPRSRGIHRSHHHRHRLDHPLRPLRTHWVDKELLIAKPAGLRQARVRTTRKVKLLNMTGTTTRISRRELSTKMH